MIRHLLASCFLPLLAAGAAAQAGQPAQPRPARLMVTSPAQLVNCAPVTPVPCMSLGVTAVDDAGKPAAFELPSTRELPGRLTLQAGDASTQVHPFYVSTGKGLDSGQHANVVLLMVDISGSMNDPSPGGLSRFAAVKAALTRYVGAMEEGSDEIAIVPFESHSVVPTIQAAVFSSHKADLLGQLGAMPAPGPKNNTALFQAVFTGVQTLKNEVSSLEREGHPAGELQPHLIVMTDGKNEVTAGDDPNLLNGPLGLTQAAEQVGTSRLDVIGIGFGDRAAIDAAALQRLSTRFFYAADADQLLDALHATRNERSHVIDMTWLLSENNRIALAGRDQIWTPALMLKDGSIVSSDPVRIVMPATASPLFERAASHVELEQLIAAHPPALSGWSTVVVHLLLFLAASVLLLILWFWVPRLVWAERYLSAAPPATRWSSERQSPTTASGVQIRSSNLPPGFHSEAESAGPLQRSPAQTTHVGPRPEPAKTRLKFD